MDNLELDKLKGLTNSLSNSVNNLKSINLLYKDARPLSLIESEIIFFKNQTATGIIEIGKRLIEAKQQLQHGEWGKWLEEKVDFSQRTANQFMKVAEEFANSQSIANLGSRKLFLLLEVPEEERQTFIESTHVVKGEEKTVEDMTTRELQEAIKAKKQAEDRARQAEEQLKIQSEKTAEEVQSIITEKNYIVSERDKYIRQLQDEQSHNEELQEAVIEKDKKISELKANPPMVEVIKEVEKPVTVEVVPPDYLILKSRVEALSASESKLRQEAMDAKNESNAYKKSLETFKNGARSIEQVSLTDFKFAVRAFMRDVTPLVYLGEQFSELKQTEIEKYLEEIELIERWISDFKQALDGKAGGSNLIIMEGGYSK